ncbi:MAG: hypothetical protein GWP10_18720 [Nitrospiraceae bacterium]|nr:hypothetical protein [Nitrospiraceae bacterium]
MNGVFSSGEDEFHHRGYALIGYVLSPQALANAVYDIKKVGFQLFPEVARFFERFLANRAEISPDIDTTKSFFVMLIVSVVIHSIPEFRAVWRHNSPKYAVCGVFEVVRVVLEDWVAYVHTRKV